MGIASHQAFAGVDLVDEQKLVERLDEPGLVQPVNPTLEMVFGEEAKAINSLAEAEKKYG